MKLNTDPTVVRSQYETDENLTIRQRIHEQYTSPKIDFVEWALERVRWRGDEKVLDLGCGRGTYYDKINSLLPDVSYIGLDLFIGMLEHHPAKERTLNSDAHWLPFASGSFDVVMANHMLYHVPNIDHAISEVKRILKPNGVFLATTNSNFTMPEIAALMQKATSLINRNVDENWGYDEIQKPFSLENAGPQIARHFYSVVRHDSPSALIFKNPEPLIAYIQSLRSLREKLLPPKVDWDDMITLVYQLSERVIDHLGELQINKLAGALVATDNSDFIQEYVALKNKLNPPPQPKPSIKPLQRKIKPLKKRGK